MIIQSLSLKTTYKFLVRIWTLNTRTDKRRHDHTSGDFSKDPWESRSQWLGCHLPFWLSQNFELIWIKFEKLGDQFLNFKCNQKLMWAFIGIHLMPKIHINLRSFAPIYKTITEMLIWIFLLYGNHILSSCLRQISYPLGLLQIYHLPGVAFLDKTINSLNEQSKETPGAMYLFIFCYCSKWETSVIRLLIGYCNFSLTVTILIPWFQNSLQSLWKLWLHYILECKILRSEAIFKRHYKRRR